MNNAGIGGGGNLLESLDLAGWQRTIDVNLKGSLLMARRAVTPMSPSGGGSMVHIASIAGLVSAGRASPTAPPRARSSLFPGTSPSPTGAPAFARMSSVPGTCSRRSSAAWIRSCARRGEDRPARRGSRRLGHRPGGAVSGERRVPLHQWRVPAGRWGRYSDHGSARGRIRQRMIGGRLDGSPAIR